MNMSMFWELADNWLKGDTVFVREFIMLNCPEPDKVWAALNQTNWNCPRDQMLRRFCESYQQVEGL